MVILSHFMNESFKRWTDQYLIDPHHQPEEFSRLLYFAPFVVFAVSNHPDPRFSYANESSQKLFLYNWNEFTALPSTTPIEPSDFPQSQRMLDECSSQGFSKAFEGIRITSTGKRFKIGRTILWNIIDDSGRKIGKAVVFNKWEFI